MLLGLLAGPHVSGASPWPDVAVQAGSDTLLGLEPALRRSDGPAVRAVEVSMGGAALEISTDTIAQPPHPTRLALRCQGDVRQATIRVVLRPA